MGEESFQQVACRARLFGNLDHAGMKAPSGSTGPVGHVQVFPLTYSVQDLDGPPCCNVFQDHIHGVKPRSVVPDPVRHA